MARLWHDDGFDAQILGIVGHHDLGHQDAARRGHEAGGEQIGQQLFADHAGIGAQNGPRDPGHAHRHHRKELRRGKAGEIRTDDERALALPDEDIRRGAQAFDLGDSGNLLDRTADPFDHELHDAEIIEDRDERGEEDDHRQCGNRKAGAPHFRAREGTEEKSGSRFCVAEEVGDPGRHPLNDRAAPRRTDYQQREPRLQQKGRHDDARANPATVR